MSEDKKEPSEHEQAVEEAGDAVVLAPTDPTAVLDALAVLPSRVGLSRRPTPRRPSA
jgi:hypothetical protein